MDLLKILLALGIDAGDEELTDEKVVEIIKAKMVQADPPKRPKTAVPSAILEMLALKEDATESDARAAIMVLKYPPEHVPRERYEGLEQQLHDRDVKDLIDTACRPGEGEMECKLYPHEREWAMGEAQKDFAMMKTFIARRPKILSLMAKLPSGKKDSAHIDETTAAIMKQMGVSRETFIKYNTAH